MQGFINPGLRLTWKIIPPVATQGQLELATSWGRLRSPFVCSPWSCTSLEARASLDGPPWRCWPQCAWQVVSPSETVSWVFLPTKFALSPKSLCSGICFNKIWFNWDRFIISCQISQTHTMHYKSPIHHSVVQQGHSIMFWWFSRIVKGMESCINLGNTI